MNTLFVLLSLMGVILTIAGLIFKARPPLKINSLYGYRTPSSRRNQDTWQVANSYSILLMIRIGIIMLCLALVTLLFPDLGESESTAIGLSIISFCLLMLIILTETHLKRIFDKEGNRK